VDHLEPFKGDSRQFVHINQIFWIMFVYFGLQFVDELVELANLIIGANKGGLGLFL